MYGYVLSLYDWPLEDENGRAIHYMPDVSNPPLKRGVLLSSSTGKPLFPWQRLLDGFTLDGAEILNLVSYQLPNGIKQAKQRSVQESLETAFKIAFPDKIQAKVVVYNQDNDERKGCMIQFYTPSDNVRASDLIAMAAFRGWLADGQPLGVPICIGLETTEVVQAVKFENIPKEYKHSLVATLPQYFTESFCPSQSIQAVDIWEQQSRSSKDAIWKFDSTVMALIRVKATPTADNKLKHIVDQWPGWFHFEEESLIEIQNPGRFDFCKNCKHSTQDLDGADRRHTADNCIRIMCGVCGHAGHDASDSDRPQSHKTACQEGKKRRLEERKKKEEARKRQKTTHDAANVLTTPSESSQNEQHHNIPGSESVNEEGQRGDTAQS